jgi:PST family polysaccharide transporter
VPVIAIASCSIFVLRSQLVGLLFTPEFLPMTGLMGWQMLGDVFKIASWLFAYVVIGKARTAVFVSTEIFFSVSLYFLTVVLMDKMGPSGFTAAYAANYVLYFLTMYWLVMVKQ